MTLVLLGEEGGELLDGRWNDLPHQCCQANHAQHQRAAEAISQHYNVSFPAVTPDPAGQ